MAVGVPGRRQAVNASQGQGAGWATLWGLAAWEGSRAPRRRVQGEGDELRTAPPPPAPAPEEELPGTHLLCSSTKLTISSSLLGLSGMVTGSSMKAS